MKQTINKCIFTSNSVISASFSYDASVALFEYIEEYEQDCGIELDFDPVALRCDFDEYESMKEIAENYWDLKDIEDEEDKIDWLRDRTTVIEFNGGSFLITPF